MLRLIESLVPTGEEENRDEIVSRVSRVLETVLQAKVHVVLDQGVQRPTTHPEPPMSPSHLELELPPSSPIAGRIVAERPSGLPFSRGDQNLLAAAAPQIAVLLERCILREEVAAAAVIAERSRLAREIHDGVAQHLAFLKMRLAWLRRGVGDPIAGQLASVESVVEMALAEARYAISTLRSDTHQLPAARAVCDYALEFGHVSGLQVLVNDDDSGADTGPLTRVELVRIVQEALNNVRKHAAATTVTVSVGSEANGLRVTVSDDGVGYRVQDQDAGHFGLDIMRERASSIGGSVEVTSKRGQGTTVSVWVPGENGMRQELRAAQG